MKNWLKEVVLKRSGPKTETSDITIPQEIVMGYSIVGLWLDPNDNLVLGLKSLSL